MKSFIRTVSIVLIIALALGGVACADWVSKYEAAIRKEYKSGRMAYFGVAELGTDGSPELLLITGKPGNQRINFFYISENGSVHKSSKYISMPKMYEDFRGVVYDTNDGGIIVIKGSTKKKGWTYQLSQNSKRVLWLQEIFRITGNLRSGKPSSFKYYYKGKKYAYKKYLNYKKQYENMLSDYDPVAWLSNCGIESLNTIIERFRDDVYEYFD